MPSGAARRNLRRLAAAAPQPAGARQAGERWEEACFELGGVKIKRFARLITALSRRRLGSRHGYARCDLGTALP